MAVSDRRTLAHVPEKWRPVFRQGLPPRRRGTCATQSEVERMPLPFERAALRPPSVVTRAMFLAKCGIHRSGTCGKKAPLSGAMEIMAAVPNHMTAIAIRAPGG